MTPDQPGDPKPYPYPLIVTAGVLRSGDSVLIARRSSGPLAGLWEFPGGKLEPAESPEACLARELREELGLEVEVGDIFAVVYHPYPGRPVLLLAYSCRLCGGHGPQHGGAGAPGAEPGEAPSREAGAPRGAEAGQAASPGAGTPRGAEGGGQGEAPAPPGAQWVRIPDLDRYDFAPADRPIVARLRQASGEKS